MSLGMSLTRMSEEWKDSAENAEERGLEVALGPEKTEGLAVEAEGLAVMEVIEGIVCNDLEERADSDEQWSELGAHNLLQSKRELCNTQR